MKWKKTLKVLKAIIKNREDEIKQIRNQLRRVEKINLEIKEGLL